MSLRSRVDAVIGGAPQNPTPQTEIVRRPSALRVLRFLLLGCGLVAFAVGLWTGFARLGVGLTGAAPQFVEFHGALMICGFFGTLISVERAVAFNRPLAYLIPVCAATGVVALLAKATTFAGAAFLMASLGLAAASLGVTGRNTVDRRAMLGVGHFAVACKSSGCRIGGLVAGVSCADGRSRATRVKPRGHTATDRKSFVCRHRHRDIDWRFTW